MELHEHAVAKVVVAADGDETVRRFPLDLFQKRHPIPASVAKEGCELSDVRAEEQHDDESRRHAAGARSEQLRDRTAHERNEQGQGDEEVPRVDETLRDETEQDRRRRHNQRRRDDPFESPGSRASSSVRDEETTDQQPRGHQCSQASRRLEEVRPERKREGVPGRAQGRNRRPPPAFVCDRSTHQSHAPRAVGTPNATSNLVASRPLLGERIQETDVHKPCATNTGR